VVVVVVVPVPVPVGEVVEVLVVYHLILLLKAHSRSLRHSIEHREIL